MEHRISADEQNNSAPETRSEQEPASQPAPDTGPPEEQPASTDREKTMTASTPGTEYWLP